MFKYLESALVHHAKVNKMFRFCLHYMENCASKSSKVVLISIFYTSRIIDSNYRIETGQLLNYSIFTTLHLRFISIKLSLTY